MHRPDDAEEEGASRSTTVTGDPLLLLPSYDAMRIDGGHPPPPLMPGRHRSQQQAPPPPLPSSARLGGWPAATCPSRPLPRRVTTRCACIALPRHPLQAILRRRNAGGQHPSLPAMFPSKARNATAAAGAAVVVTGSVASWIVPRGGMTPVGEVPACWDDPQRPRPWPCGTHGERGGGPHEGTS